MDIYDLGGTETDKLNNIGMGVLQVLAIIGSGLSIIFLICLGIKYMLGSVEERADKIAKQCKIYNKEYHRARFALPNFLKELTGADK